MYQPPDQYERAAEAASKRGCADDAFRMTVASIKARAEWVTLNGRWVRRTNIMRKDA